MPQIWEKAMHFKKMTTMVGTLSSSASIAGNIAKLSVTHDKTKSPSTLSAHTFGGIRRFTKNIIPSVKGFKITLQHRINMANEEIEEMKQALLDFEHLTTKVKAQLKAEIEGLKILIQETKEMRMSFENNIVQKQVNPLTRKISAEKFIKFKEGWLKSVENKINNLTIKNCYIKSQIKDAKKQLGQRNELSEILHAIDFQLLDIQNERHVDEIQVKNQRLLKLKARTAKYSVSLTNHKQKMNSMQTELKNLHREISCKQKQIETLQKEKEIVNSENKDAEKQLKNIKQLTENYEMPDVIDFLKLEVELRDTQRTCERLKRHSKIQMNRYKT